MGDVVGALLRVVVSGEEDEGICLLSPYQNGMGRELGRLLREDGLMVGCFGGLVSLSLFFLYSLCFIIFYFLVFI
jgi:hypothetical protein